MESYQSRSMKECPKSLEGQHCSHYYEGCCECGQTGREQGQKALELLKQINTYLEAVQPEGEHELGCCLCTGRIRGMLSKSKLLEAADA